MGLYIFQMVGNMFATGLQVVVAVQEANSCPKDTRILSITGGLPELVMAVPTF